MFSRFTHGDDGKKKVEELPLTGGVPEPKPTLTEKQLEEDGWTALAPGKREHFTKFRDENVIIVSLNTSSHIMYLMPNVIKHLNFTSWMTVLMRNHQIALIGAPEGRGYKVTGVLPEDQHKTASINITKLNKKYAGKLKTGAYVAKLEGNMVIINTNEEPIPLTD